MFQNHACFSQAMSDKENTKEAIVVDDDAVRELDSDNSDPG